MIFYLTFGFGHIFANRYMEVKAGNYGDARRMCFEAFGPHWAFLYTEEEFAGQTERFGLTPLGILHYNNSGVLRCSNAL